MNLNELTTHILRGRNNKEKKSGNVQESGKNRRRTKNRNIKP